MADYRLSDRAAQDLEGILFFSIERFGLERAAQYKAALEGCLSRVSADPRLGRQLAGRASRFFRYNCQRHVLFFTIEATGIFVVRVLHAAMDQKRYLPT